MSKDSPIDLMFGGMAKLGPGSDACTRQVLQTLPPRTFDVVVDAGCGTGRQTLVLARELGVRVHAVDSHPPFLADLTRGAATTGVAHLVETHCMDMQDIPQAFPRIDLLWSEGAAYNIGFANALTTWARALAPGGFAAVSELVWLRDDPPEDARAFFESGHPDMRLARENLATAEAAGYQVLDTFTLPAEAWTEGYYDVLEPRAKALLDHPDASVRDFARETVREVEVFRASDASYGYVFYLLQRA